MSIEADQYRKLVQELEFITENVDLSSYNIQTDKSGVPIIMSIDSAIRKMDNATEGAINLQNIRHVLSAGGDIMMLIQIRADLLKGWEDEDVNANYANDTKGEVIIDHEWNIVDGRHRTANAVKQNKPIKAYIPVQQAALIDWYNNKKADSSAL